MSIFAELGLRPEILSALDTLGFTEPTPIQAQAIPIVLENPKQDLIASAQTGTGKTAAFGLPTIQLINEKDKSTQALVLCPTRELCLQITRDLQVFAKSIRKLSVLAVYGGSPIYNQIKDLEKGAQIVVATPGRAIDLIKRKKLVLDKIERLILDEADEMLTMGFKEELETILESIPDERQTLLFSATMSPKIKSITKKYMESPLEIAAARVNMAASTVTHIYYHTQAKHRYEALKRLADMNPDIYGIVFCRTRRDTKETADQLQQDGYNADALHGDLSQAQRDEVMQRFRKKSLQILVATDVASRGLDVDNLTHVINLNLPDDAEVYVHRSGRTGRAGNKGTSVAIITSKDKKKIREIERIAKIKFDLQQVPDGKAICSKQLMTLIDRVKNTTVEMEQIEPFLESIYEKLEGLDREALIQHFISAEFNRFLEYYKHARDINVKAKDKKERKSRGQVQFVRLYLNVGKKNKLSPPKLIGLINDALDSSEAAIGKIDIQKSFTFFDIDQQYVQTLVKNLSRKKFNGSKLFPELANEPTFDLAPKPNKKKDFSKPKGYKKSSSRNKGKDRRDKKKKK